MSYEKPRPAFAWDGVNRGTTLLGQLPGPLSPTPTLWDIGRAVIAAPAPWATIIRIHPRGSGGNFGRILQRGGLNPALASLSASAGVLSSVNAWYVVGVIIDGNGGGVKAVGCGSAPTSPRSPVTLPPPKNGGLGIQVYRRNNGGLSASWTGEPGDQGDRGGDGIEVMNTYPLI